MNPLTKEEFLEKLKTDRDFNNKYGRKHITEGKQVLPPCHYGFQVYTRELSLEERTEYKKKRDGIARTFASYTHQMLDGSNTPTKLITITYNNETIESHE